MRRTGFHLPHNAILPEEVKFILKLLDINREYYLYDDLKSMMFEEEIKQDVFKKFHEGMYRNFMNDPKLKKCYEKIYSGELSYNDIKRIPYSPKKDLNGNWNEQARDYFEFLAFIGLMPSYYKGKSIENEKRHYIGNTLRLYKSGKLNYQDLLFKMKFRNASKNYDNIEQYNVKNRPFVVALKVMNILKLKGFESIDGNSLSYIIRNIKDEDKIDENKVFPIDFSSYTKKELRELGRGTTFLKRHLVEGLNIKLVPGKKTCFDLSDFDIKKYKFMEKAVYIGELYDDIEVTPLLIKCMMNPKNITDNDLKDHLVDLGLINPNESLYDYNVDTDLIDRSLVIKVLMDEEVEEVIYSTRIETTDLFKKGKEISESGNGTLYEEFLYEFLKDKFGERRVKYLGANTVAQRLSDMVCDLVVVNNDMKSKIRIIIEAKSGSAITAFDDRKEQDNVLNTLTDKRLNQDYDGIWYMVVDSNKIPKVDLHGGFRENNNQVSFKQKLFKIQSAVMPNTAKLTMVTAFSYTEFMKFMDSINYNKNMDFISRIQAPDFWTWSNKFVGTSYVTIRA